MIVTNAKCFKKYKKRPHVIELSWENQRINVPKQGTDPQKSILVEKVIFHPEYLKG